MGEGELRKPGLQARIIDGILWRMGRVGVYITPFVTILEGANASQPWPIQEPFSFHEIGEADIDELIRLEPHYSRERLYTWFARDKVCFGLRDGARMVAKSWCDLKEMSDPAAYRKLEPGEAYLFAAYSDPAYRGRNLAPMLRSACYEELRRRGYQRFYSHSDYFNFPARRFKAKLGAVEEDLRIEVRLANKWTRTFTVKRYI